MKITVKKVKPVGQTLAFVTRTCCGPDGSGPCQARTEGLRCGLGYIPTYPEPTEGEERRGRRLRALRRGLNLTIGDVAELLGVTATVVGELERGAAEVEDWDELEQFLRANGKDR